MTLEVVLCSTLLPFTTALVLHTHEAWRQTAQCQCVLPHIPWHRYKSPASRLLSAVFCSYRMSHRKDLTFSYCIPQHLRIKLVFWGCTVLGYLILKTVVCGARAHTVLAENEDLVPSTYTARLVTVLPPAPGSVPLLASSGTCTHPQKDTELFKIEKKKWCWN